ncbi:hypothetical protein BDZ94DRAFT_1250060 [Collybia nuda]|uniref:Uncharacterized protein n=1 Tax=Collybia nuda TaxID=64659 RepID=A0A9P6CNE7_9AGAR|nr:hypothetical protein BDZ94DRAFT_1250060 [Collybia nuda]
MMTDTLILTVFVYGPKESRVEVEMRPKIPPDVQGNLQKLEAWSQEVVFTGGMDVKHSNRWDYEICNKPARETIYNVASWIHLPEPRIVLYIHQICEAGISPCNFILEAQHRRITQEMGLPPQPPKSPAQTCRS